MEDFFKFLLIAGVIVIGIAKEIKKNKAKNEKNKRPAPSMHPIPETAPNTNPMPEAWGSLDELLKPIPLERPTKMDSPSKKNRKKQEISVESSLANSANQDRINSKAGSQYDTPSQSSANENETEDYAIHSAEEARRAIIWGEILQRKY